MHPINFFTLLVGSSIFAISLPAQTSSEAKAVTVELSSAGAKPNYSTGQSPQTDDIVQLKRLAAGVGWEFAPNWETTDGLKSMGIKTLRCINVDNIQGEFTKDGQFVMTEEPNRLDANLATCKAIQARPHVIIGINTPQSLKLTVKETRERMAILGQAPGNRIYWNGDWAKMRAYWKSIFKYVVVKKGFKNARFEVGNEPDIDGQFIRLVGSDGAMGSPVLYAAYLEVYENAALAAQEFEAENRGEHVLIGGPAISWAYTFKYAPFKWIEKFLADGAAKKTRLDFIGVHYYGNISSLNGEYTSNYPSFVSMMASTRKARDRHYPKVPILLTEWGPSYHTNNTPKSILMNGSNIGAAWSAAFLKTMLDQKVDEALFLVTTDGMGSDPDTNAPGDNWGWPAFFVNPTVFDRAWPKAPAHVFDMVSRLSGKRIGLETKDDKGQPIKTGIDGIASYDQAAGRVTTMLWNYAAKLPEGSPPTELGEDISVTLRLPAGMIKGSARSLRVKTWMVSKTMSNARTLFEKDGTINERSQLQLIDDRTLPKGSSDYTLTMPACSVAFMTVERP